MWAPGRKRVAAARFPVEFIPAAAEAIPAPDRGFDTVVLTWTLRAIGEPEKAPSEVARVLMPTGRFIFVEHGRAPDHNIAAHSGRLRSGHVLASRLDCKRNQ